MNIQENDEMAMAEKDQIPKSSAAKNNDYYEINNILITSIRKLQSNLKRDKYFLKNLKQQNSQKKNLDKAKINSEQLNEKMEKIKINEEKHKEQIERKYTVKQHKRDVVYSNYIKEKQEKLMIQQEKNKIKSLKSKIFLEETGNQYDNKYREYLNRDSSHRAKVDLMIKLKNEEIQQRANLNNFRLNEAKERYFQMENEKEQRAAVDYFTRIKSASVIKQQERKNINHLDELRKTGQFDKIKELSNRKLEEIQSKMYEKELKFSDHYNKMLDKKQKENLIRNLTFEDRYNQAQLNKRVVYEKIKENQKSIINKEMKISNFLQEKKHNNEVRYMIKKELDEMKKSIKQKLDSIVNERHILTLDEIKESLYSIIPAEFLENKSIFEEIDKLNLIETKERKTKNNNVDMNDEVSNNSKGKETYHMVEERLNNEILSLLSLEKTKEDERAKALQNEKDADKRKKLNAIFTQERLNANHLIIQKQKEKERVLNDLLRNNY